MQFTVKKQTQILFSVSEQSAFISRCVESGSCLAFGELNKISIYHCNGRWSDQQYECYRVPGPYRLSQHINSTSL